MANLYFLRRFPTTVVVWAKRGGEIVKTVDKGRRFTNDKGETYFRLKSHKINTVPISWEYIYNVSHPKKQMNRLYVYSPSPALFFPLKLNEDLQLALKAGSIEYVENMMPTYIKDVIKEIEDPKKVTIPVNEKIEQWLDWLGFRIYKNTVLTDYRSNLERYFPQMIFAVALIFVAISAWMIFRGMEGIMMRAEASEVRWMKANERYTAIDERLINLVEGGKIPVEVTKPPPSGV